MPGRRILMAGWAGYTLLFATFAVLTPYLPLYLGARGFPPSRIGLLLGSFELAGIAGPILVTLLADRLQRYRRFIALSLLGSVACLLLLHATRSFAAAFPLMIGLGFCFRSVIPLTDALFGRLLDDPARQYGLVRAAGSAGFLVTSLVLRFTGWVSGDEPTSILTAFAVLAVPAVLVVAVLPTVHRAAKAAGHPAPETTPDTAPLPVTAPVRAGFDARFWTVIGVIFLAAFGNAAHYSFFSLYLRNTFALANVSAIWAIGAAAEVPMVLFSGRVLARFGIRGTLTAAVAAVTVRLALYGLFPALGVVLAAQLLHAFTFGALHTASVAYVNTKIDASRRGLGMAVYSTLSIGLASFLASGVGGYVVEAAGYRALFLVYAAVPVLGLAVLAARGRWLLGSRPSTVLRAEAATLTYFGRPAAEICWLASGAERGYTRAMRKLIQQYAKDLTAGLLASGFEHSYRVYHLTREIGEGLAYDDDILHAACFLHDVEMSVGHPRSSADKAEAILHETGFDPDKIPLVTEAILNHMPAGKPASVEAKLLFDANLLDSIGAVGMARLAVGGVLWYHYKTMPEIVEYLRRELALTEQFHFPRSRDLAKEKIAFTRAALEQFERELRL